MYHYFGVYRVTKGKINGLDIIDSNIKFACINTLHKQRRLVNGIKARDT